MHMESKWKIPLFLSFEVDVRSKCRRKVNIQIVKAFIRCLIPCLNDHAISTKWRNKFQNSPWAAGGLKNFQTALTHSHLKYAHSLTHKILSLMLGLNSFQVLLYWMSYVNPSNAKATFVQTQWRKDFWRPSKPCHVGIHQIALAECSQMSTHLLGFLVIFHIFCIFLYWSN